MQRLIPALALALLPLATPDLSGQMRGSISGALGYSNFLDESPQRHVTAGGSARIYFTRRAALEPEITYMRQSASDQDLLVQVNIIRDFGKATGRLVPFASAGGGRIWTYESRYTVSGWTASFGGGARYFWTERFFIAPEFRIGGEPLFRLQVSAGWARR